MSISRRDASRSRKVYSYYRPRPVEQIVDTDVKDMYDVMVWNESPAGILDGLNVIFQISCPANPSKTMVFLNDTLQANGIDYTLSDRSLVFTIAPKPGDKLSVTYAKIVES